MPSKKSRPDSTRAAQPRLRILAGPNGSGKSTIKGELKPEWIGVFVNADEIERSLRDADGALDLAALGITGRPAQVLRRLEGHIRRSAFAQELGLKSLLGRMAIDASLRLLVPAPYDSYLASVLADALRRELLDKGQTFTFETVMSSRDRLDDRGLRRRPSYLRVRQLRLPAQAAGSGHRRRQDAHAAVANVERVRIFHDEPYTRPTMLS